MDREKRLAKLFLNLTSEVPNAAPQDAGSESAGAMWVGSMEHPADAALELAVQLEREYVRMELREIRNHFGGREGAFWAGFELALDEIEERLKQEWGE